MKDKILFSFVLILVGCGAVYEDAPQPIQYDQFEICDRLYSGELFSKKESGSSASFTKRDLYDVIKKHCEIIGYQGKGDAENVDPEPF